MIGFFGDIFPFVARYAGQTSALAIVQLGVFIAVIHLCVERTLGRFGVIFPTLPSCARIANNSLEEITRLCFAMGLLLTFSGLYSYMGDRSSANNGALLLALGSSAVGYSAWTVCALAAVLDSFREPEGKPRAESESGPTECGSLNRSLHESAPGARRATADSSHRPEPSPTANRQVVPTLKNGRKSSAIVPPISASPSAAPKVNKPKVNKPKVNKPKVNKPKVNKPAATLPSDSGDEQTHDGSAEHEANRRQAVPPPAATAVARDRVITTNGQQAQAQDDELTCAESPSSEANRSTPTPGETSNEQEPTADTRGRRRHLGGAIHHATEPTDVELGGLAGFERSEHGSDDIDRAIGDLDSEGWCDGDLA